MKIEDAIKEYQCPSCVRGSNLKCGKYKKSNLGSECANHAPGTIITNMGIVYLYFKKFNHLGSYPTIQLHIFETQKQQEKEFKYDWLNIPVWKFQNEKNNIFIRGFSSRLNKPFLHIILEGNFEKYKGLEITQDLLKTID